MESLLLQESSSGYFNLEAGIGRLLLETSGPPDVDASQFGGHINIADVRPLILRSDDDLVALISTLL